MTAETRQALASIPAISALSFSNGSMQDAGVMGSWTAKVACMGLMAVHV